MELHDGDDLLFDADSDAGADSPPASEGEEDDAALISEPSSGRHSDKAGGVDIAGAATASTNSHQSSTLRESLDYATDPSAGPTPSPPVAMPAAALARRNEQQRLALQQQQLAAAVAAADSKGFGGGMFGGGGGGGGGGMMAGAGPHRMMAASMPARTSAARLGTSAPIAIPNMARWRPPGSAAAAAAAANAADAAGDGGDGDNNGVAVAPALVAGTFIPPHQLSARGDFTFSFTGASPAACVKRDRLRARNAILRSTGFLEPGAQPGSAGAAGAAPAAAAASAASLDASAAAAVAAVTAASGGGSAGAAGDGAAAAGGAVDVGVIASASPAPRSGLTAALTTIGEAAL